MNSEELKKLITSFIDVVNFNYQLYNDHVINKSKYKSNEYDKNGNPNVAQKFGYKANKDIISPEQYRNLEIKTRPISSGKIISRPGINFLATGQTAKEGIYPFFCYDLNDDILYLNYGTSNAKKPKSPWSYSPSITLHPVVDSPDSRTYYKRSNAKSDCTTWDYDEILQYLDNIIDDLEITLGATRTKSANGLVGAGTVNIVHPTGTPMTPPTPKTTTPKTAHSISTPPPPTSHPLNLILFGPPGTGKTYNTLFKALEIIEGKTKEELENEKKEQDKKWEEDTEDPKKEKKGYDVLKERYEKYVKSGQIVFTTFHQSMSYEDFIEGIKPIVDDNAKIEAIHTNKQSGSTTIPQFGEGTTEIKNVSRMKYEVRDGIFKKISETASNVVKQTKTIDTAFDELIQDIKNKKVTTINLKNGKKSAPLSVSTQNTIKWERKTKVREVSANCVSKKRLLKLCEKYDAKGIETMSNIEASIRNVINGCNSSYYWAVANYLYQKINNETIEKENSNNYVLIIDEINRGNVAQIFGELITLIEPSKRLGNDEEMKAILPYSSAQKGESVYFGVPNNLYIIGTMNTADRSVEALDTALRRRFSFEEMMPRPELLGDTEVCDVKLSDLLKTINARIVALKDREHQIGHSYFMGCPDDKAKAEAWLTGVFKDKIIPLLQEYYYGDYKKIYYVLGPGFVEKKTEKTVFAVDIKDDEYDFDIAEEKYEIKTESFDIQQAIKDLKVQS